MIIFIIFQLINKLSKLDQKLENDIEFLVKNQKDNPTAHVLERLVRSFGQFMVYRFMIFFVCSLCHLCG